MLPKFGLESHAPDEYKMTMHQSGARITETHNPNMPLQRVLWLVEANETSVSTSCEPLPPGVGISRVTDLAEALAAVRSGKADCVLISSRPEGRERETLLDLFLGADAQTPVIFWDRDLSAREAIELVREGAYTCHGDRESWETLLESIGQACQEKQRREQGRSTDTVEAW